MSLPIGETNKAILNDIKADDRLYIRFRNNQAFMELEKEVADMKMHAKANRYFVLGGVLSFQRGAER